MGVNWTINSTAPGLMPTKLTLTGGAINPKVKAQLKAAKQAAALVVAQVSMSHSLVSISGYAASKGEKEIRDQVHIHVAEIEAP